MGLSNAEIAGGDRSSETQSMASQPVAAPADSGPAHQSFGDKLGSYIAQKYPVAGGLAGSVFGDNSGGQQQQGAASAPLGQMPNQQDPNFGLVDGHAGRMANSSSGIGTLLKLFGI